MKTIANSLYEGFGNKTLKKNLNSRDFLKEKLKKKLLSIKTR